MHDKYFRALGRDGPKTFAENVPMCLVNSRVRHLLITFRN